jgi:putative oxidoreductase
MSLTTAADLAARLCLVLMFPFSALDKIWHWRNSLAQTDSAGVPARVGALMLAVAILVEGLTPILIVLGLWDRPAAFLLAAFCVVTAVLYHPFWACPDLFSPRGDSRGRAHFWEFVKNVGLVGGLLLVVFAGSLTPPDEAARPANWSSAYLAGQARDGDLSVLAPERLAHH